MRRRTAACVAVILGLSGVFVLALAGPAFAHVERNVGAYRFTVGWGTEPTYASIENSVQLILSTRAGKPVTTLGDSLKVEVISGDQKMQFPLVSTFDPGTGRGTPGDYRAWLIPTSPGDYTFHFFGTIGSQKVDERFTSGPTTFDEVADPAQVEFPAKVPTGIEIAGRVDREIPRLNDAIAAARSDAGDKASTARTLAIIGIVVGALGLVVAASALIGWRRAARRPGPVAVAPGTEVAARD
jgi:hypothetical protein